jgi:DNA topoisomerase I
MPSYKEDVARVTVVLEKLRASKLAQDADFVESEHPRDSIGRFGRGTGISISHNAETKKWSGQHDRAKALGIPPAWTEVQINSDPEGELQAFGRDAKGRAQYIYSAAHSTAAAQAKFARLKTFNKAVPGLIKQSISDMDNAALSAAQRDSAAIIRLISLTGFRIGGDSDTQADEQAFGASTLLNEHVTVSGSKISFKFTGKDGVAQAHVIDDAGLAAYVTAHKAKGGDKLFANATNGTVRDYFHKLVGADYKVKDLRTWKATALAYSLCREIKTPLSPAAFKKARFMVGDAVCSVLGNTRSMALNAYIDPAVFEGLRRISAN